MEKLVSIGRTKKPNGIDGGMWIHIAEEYQEDFLGAEVIFLEEKGQPVPYFMEWLDEEKWIVGLDGVTDKETAAHLSNTPIFLREKDILPKAIPLEETVESDLAYAQYIGYQMVHQESTVLGIIQDIIAYPQQEMAALEYQGKEILIPMNEQLITQIDTDQKIIYMSLPEGMISIQL